MEKREFMKQENNDRWLEEIHDKMMDFEADVSADGWMKLESALSPKINYWKYIRRAVAAIVILLCGIGIANYT